MAEKGERKWWEWEEREVLASFESVIKGRGREGTGRLDKSAGRARRRRRMDRRGKEGEGEEEKGRTTPPSHVNGSTT